MPLRLTIAMLMSDSETEWTLNASLTRLSNYKKCSKRRILGHSAQATSLLPIEGTTKCSRIARGFGCGSISGFAAEVKPKAGLGFKASAAFPVLKLIAMLAFPGGSFTRWSPAPFTAHCFANYRADLSWAELWARSSSERLVKIWTIARQRQSTPKMRANGDASLLLGVTQCAGRFGRRLRAIV
jgi:hypothetical protein